MVQTMVEGAVTLTRDGLILFSNEQFASMLGLPLERVIGSSHSRLRRGGRCVHAFGAPHRFGREEG